MDKIRSGLYIGGIEDALPFYHGARQGITHVLSMVSMAPLDLDELAEMRESLPRYGRDEGKQQLVATKVVPVGDTEWQPLLDVLEECIEFIAKGRRSCGEVLVHCHEGISRSVSVVAAYLMKTERLTAEAAILEVQRLRPRASPNRGFVKQLNWFQEMGYKVDKSSSLYLDYRRGYVRDLADAHGKGFAISCSHLAAASAGDTKVELRCKACCTRVCSDRNLLHGRQNCASIFVEPMQWMSHAVPQDNDNRASCGSLFCPTCGGKLGRFHWSGAPCYCGAQVYQLFGKRVVTDGPSTFA